MAAAVAATANGIVEQLNWKELHMEWWRLANHCRQLYQLKLAEHIVSKKMRKKLNLNNKSHFECFELLVFFWMGSQFFFALKEVKSYSVISATFELPMQPH